MKNTYDADRQELYVGRGDHQCSLCGERLPRGESKCIRCKATLPPLIKQFVVDRLDGDEVRITWEVLRAENVFISGVVGYVRPSGVCVVPSAQAEYTLSAFGSGGIMSSCERVTDQKDGSFDCREALMPEPHRKTPLLTASDNIVRVKPTGQPKESSNRSVGTDEHLRSDEQHNSLRVAEPDGDSEECSQLRSMRHHSSRLASPQVPDPLPSADPLPALANAPLRTRWRKLWVRVAMLANTGLLVCFLYADYGDGVISRLLPQLPSSSALAINRPEKPDTQISVAAVNGTPAPPANSSSNRSLTQTTSIDTSNEINALPESTSSQESPKLSPMPTPAPSLPRTEVLASYNHQTITKGCQLLFVKHKPLNIGVKYADVSLDTKLDIELLNGLAPVIPRQRLNRNDMTGMVRFGTRVDRPGIYAVRLLEGGNATQVITFELTESKAIKSVRPKKI